MSSAPRSNRLIAGLPVAVRQRWLPRLERVEVPLGLALHESGREMSHAYFPTTAIVSLDYQMADGATMEFGVVGNEGLVGVALLLGGGFTPSRAVVRAAGEALRLPAQVLQDDFARSGAAMPLLLRYIQALMAQVTQAAVCARHHSLDQRLCRWMLMSLDRSQGNELVVTHERISHLLGVRREGVTELMPRLQALGLIDCERGRIRVRDRRGLERRACECYAVVTREYDRLLTETEAAADRWSSPVAHRGRTVAPTDAPTSAVIALPPVPRTRARPAPDRAWLASEVDAA
jgi:CRP-like cAMP-binding protein